MGILNLFISYISDKLNAVCKELAAKYDCRVWPARKYTKDDELDDVTLVCEQNEKQIKFYKGYPIHCIHNSSTISEDESIFSKDMILSLDDDERIGDIISKNFQDLLQKHRNITALSPSAIQIKDGKIIKKICISIYCTGKGLVPLKEGLFPTELDGIRVDVLEGTVFPLMERNDTRHDQVNVSCSISHRFGNGYGTIGGFCSDTDNKKIQNGLLTCCHCVTPPTLESVRDVVGAVVIQPGIEPYVIENELGTVRDIRIDNYEYGRKPYFMDAAFIEMESNRKPQDGRFCDTLLRRIRALGEQLPGKNISFDEFSFDELYVKEPNTAIPEHKVHKIGQTTRCTTGLVISRCFYGSNFKVTTNLKRHFENVLKIKSKSNAEPFAVQGDSGSLVFYVEDEKVFVVGMVFATLNEYALACHIKPILQELEIQFKRF